jgi:hypothetical protein
MSSDITGRLRTPRVRAKEPSARPGAPFRCAAQPEALASPAVRAGASRASARRRSGRRQSPYRQLQTVSQHRRKSRPRRGFASRCGSRGWTVRGPMHRSRVGRPAGRHASARPAPGDPRSRRKRDRARTADSRHCEEADGPCPSRGRSTRVRRTIARLREPQGHDALGCASVPQ